MGPLETLLRPLAAILNRNIEQTTPARELSQQLDGTTVAVQVRDTALAMYFQIDDEVIVLAADSEQEPDVIISGSLLSLARLAGPSGEDAVRDGSVELSGDVETAHAFQKLLGYARPDIEEELSRLVGDVASHRVGEMARGVSDWARGARRTMGSNVREYFQEESRELPSRYEVEKFSQQVDSLRDDVARLEARFKKFENGA